MKNYNLKDLIPQEWVRVENPRTAALLFKIMYLHSIDLIGRVLRKLKLKARNFLKVSEGK